MVAGTGYGIDWTGAQTAVIGAGLIDGDCVAEILAEMRPEDFTGEYRRYFEAFRHLTADNIPVDPVTVLNQIGPAYRELTFQLMKATPTSANISAYIAVCKEQSRLELLRRCGAELSGAATLTEAKDALDRAAGVSLDAARRTTWTANECVTEWFEALNNSQKPEYLTVGIGCLDNTLRTVLGDYVIVAGYTSHGKSAMALQMAWSISRTKRVGYFAFEGTRAQWTNRLIAYVAKVPLQKVQDRNVLGEEAQRCAQACGEISSHSISFIMAAGFSVDDIRAETLRGHFDVIFVDYLQKVSSAAAAKKFGRTQEVTEVSGGLQTMGLRYGVAVYAMSQLNRAEKSSDEYVPLPGLTDLRESGQIEQDADSVLFVHAPWRRSFPTFRILDVAKVRNGTLQSFYADFLGDVQTFTEPTQEHATSYRRLMDAKRGNKTSGFVPGGRDGSRFTKLKDVQPGDNPFHQDSLPL